MKHRNYFDVFRLFCSKEKCKVTNKHGYPLTNDLLHLTPDGEKVLFTALFNDIRFRKIWKRTIGLFPEE